jgi:hypothetical protein
MYRPGLVYNGGYSPKGIATVVPVFLDDENNSILMRLRNIIGNLGHEKLTLSQNCVFDNLKKVQKSKL